MSSKSDDLLAVWREWKACGSYAEVARRLSLSSRKQAWRLVRRAEAIFSDREEVTVSNPAADEMTVKSKSQRIKTLEDLIESAKIDTDEWTVRSWTANSWEGVGKDSEPITLHQVKASLERSPKHLFAKVSNVRNLRRKAMRMGRAVKSALIIPDSQHGFRWNYDRKTIEPMHDERALACVVELAKLMQPDEIILLGDMLDLAPWALKFPRDKSLANTTQPSDAALYDFLYQLRSASRHSVCHYVAGNHEDRIDRAILERLGEAEGLRQANDPNGHGVLTVPHLLALDSLDIKYIEYKDEYWLWNKVRVWHGTLVRKGGGKTVASMAQAGQHHEVVGHIHRLELAMKTLWGPNGSRTVTFMSPGCLTRLDGMVPAATPRVDWQQGVGVAYLDRDGTVSMMPIPINNGRLIWQGEIISAD